MENRLIFLSMAAIDENRARENRWLPDQLFPLVTHRIAAAGRTDDGGESAGSKRKGNIPQCRCLSFRCMVGVIYIFQFKNWFHIVSPI